MNTILKDSSLNKIDKYKLENLRTKIIQHETWKDLVYTKITSLDFKTKDINTKTTLKNDIKNKSSERNYWIHFISSSWLCIIMMIALPIYGFFDKNTSFLMYLFLVVFIIEPIFYAISWVFAKTFSLIPIIYDNPNLNYILNAILHLSVFLILGYFINKFNKKKTEIINQYNNININKL